MTTAMPPRHAVDDVVVSTIDAHASPTLGVPAVARQRIGRRSVTTKRVRTTVRGLWQSEASQFRPGLMISSGVARLLPAHTAGRTRTAVLRAAGLAIGRGTVIAGALRIGGTNDPRRTIRIGGRCFFNTGCQIDASADVTIGDHVYLSQDVCIITGSHAIGDVNQRAGELNAAPVSIGDGSWVGARSTILPGVSIGQGSIVAAGSVVISDVPRDTLVAGVPAREVRRLDGALDRGAA